MKYFSEQWRHKGDNTWMNLLLRNIEGIRRLEKSRNAFNETPGFLATAQVGNPTG
jgi:hypothetical protein